MVGFSQDHGTVEARLREYPALEHLISEKKATGEEGESEDDNATPTKKVRNMLAWMHV